MILRRPRPEDAGEYYRWFANSRVTEFLPHAGTEGIPLADARAYLERVSREPRPEYMMIIESVSSGAPGRAIGFTTFRNFDDRVHSAEISLVIGEPGLWGAGLGRRAIQAMIALGFEELKLQKIWLNVRDDHVRAIRLYQRLGFAIEQLHPRSIRIGEQYFGKLKLGLSRAL